MEEELIRLLENFSDRYEKEIAKQSYHINLIDELHANENAHTRILLKLLQFNYLGNFPILRSFFDLMEQKMNGKFEVGKIKYPQIRFNQENIDGLIEESEYVVIIENKIHWATDQDRQIDRYVEIAKRHCLKEDKIFVIYLTENGSKEVLDHSFNKAKTQLGYTDRQNTGRFIPMNYRMDILPWLEQTVLPNCFVRDEYLISALQQYIDHLKGMFNLRNKEKIMMEKTLEDVLALKGNEVDKIRQLREYKENLNRLSRGIEEYYQSVLSQFQSILEKDIRKRFFDFRETSYDSFKGYMTFSCKKNLIKNYSEIYFYVDIYLGWNGEYKIGWGLVTDDDSLAKKIPIEISQSIKNEFTDYLYKEGKAYWLWLEVPYNDSNFYISIQDGSLVNFLLEKHNDIISRLELIGLYNEA